MPASSPTTDRYIYIGTNTLNEKILLIALSNISPYFFNNLQTTLHNTFHRDVEVSDRIGNLNYAYDSKRHQYSSPRILSRLKRIKKRSIDKVLGLVDVDIYSPGYDFVYGEADINAGVATLSINRLIGDSGSVQDEDRVVADRLGREAVHEVGHLYGLGHCPKSRCVMRTCTCLEEVDEAGNELCESCAGELRSNLTGPEKK